MSLCIIESVNRRGYNWGTSIPEDKKSLWKYREKKIDIGQGIVKKRCIRDRVRIGDLGSIDNVGEKYRTFTMTEGKIVTCAHTWWYWRIPIHPNDKLQFWICEIYDLIMMADEGFQRKIGFNWSVNAKNDVESSLSFQTCGHNLNGINDNLFILNPSFSF